MNAPAVLGVLGFVLSSALAILGYRRYYLALQLRIREVDLVGAAGSTYLVLLRIAFVNPSSRGITVYQLRLRAQGDAKVAQPHRQYKEDRSNVSYSIPSAGGLTTVLPKSETLQFPLDIPPHQSRAGWMPLVAVLGESETSSQGNKAHHPLYFDVVLDAENISSKSIAKASERIELRTYMLRQPH